jgi:hypothetical protein
MRATRARIQPTDACPPIPTPRCGRPDGNAEIYVWDGAMLTNVTNSLADDINPALWSPPSGPLP